MRQLHIKLSFLPFFGLHQNMQTTLHLGVHVELRILSVFLKLFELNFDLSYL